MTLGALRHTAAISLLQAVVETAQIALWLGTPPSCARPASRPTPPSPGGRVGASTSSSANQGRRSCMEIGANRSAVAQVRGISVGFSARTTGTPSPVAVDSLRAR